MRLDLLIGDAVQTAKRLLCADLVTVFACGVRGTVPIHSSDLPLLWKARRMTDGIVDKCYRSREPVNVPDAYAFRSFGPKYRPQLDQLVGYRTKSQLCVPLLSSESGGRPLGVIQFTNKVVV